jgi:transposase
MSLGDDMPAPYSGDLRARVTAAVAEGSSARSTAGRFGVSISTAIRWAQRWRAEGHAEPRAMGGDHRSRLVEHRGTVLELVGKQPDLTLQEIRSALVAQLGISVGLTTLWRFLTNHQITLKKRACTRPSRIAPT